jgi:hypothetical protein|tara:strand:+ start:146 stop:847 length:702 start_codon:yes stop_codon:yes gene_type:complete
MALPKLETPVYSLTLPSSGEKIKFRPFLVKEQKLLILVNQDENKNELFDTLKSVISGCTFDKLNVESLPMFDIEYLFLKIRAKSVGSKINVTLICPDDEETQAPVDIDIDEVEVQIDEQHTNIIEVNDDIKLVMQYPILEDMKLLKDSSTMELFKIINKCVKELHHGEKIYNGPDMTEKDLNDFFESMSSEQFDKVNEFFETMPRLRHITKITNPKTKIESEIVIEGLESFLE